MRSRTIFVHAAFVLATFYSIVSPEAFAQGAAQAQLTLIGMVPSACRVTSPVASGTATNAMLLGNTIAITQLIDPSTASIKEAKLTAVMPNTLCNFKAVVSLSSKNGGMVAANGLPPGDYSSSFQRLPYTVTATWGSFGLTLETSSSNDAPLTVSKQTGGATHANLILNFSVPAGPLSVSQIAYQEDTVTIKFGPAL
jgi:hypothetical protein